MVESIEYVSCPRQGGKRATIAAKAAELLAAGWTEVTDDSAYGPPDPRLRKFNRPTGVAAPGHRCDDDCVCPADGLQMLYSPTLGLHACQDPDCEHAHPERSHDA